MANQDLFKQAIAEAKSIREVAIANAKEALEETLTPHLKELLAAKLQEMEEKDEDLDEAQGNIDADNKNPHDQLEEAEEEDEEMDDTEVEDEESDESEEDKMEDTELEDEEEMDIADMDVEDLKNMIRDIVSQEMGDEGMGDDMGMDMSPDMEDQPDDMVGSEYDSDEEEINLDELLAELDEMTSNRKITEAKKKKAKDDTDDKKKKEEMKKKDDEAKKDKMKLKEAINTINILRGQLSEVNILNAKLLYLNKVLKANTLTENQKANIITAFDKANSVKEVKLVYETVKDSFTTVKSVTKKPIAESRGFASAAQGNSTKPKVINEVNEQVLRMQKLAGIIK